MGTLLINLKLALVGVYTMGIKHIKWGLLLAQD